ncbi:hypothetical protein ACLOJK_036400 [Asimina triloba]
MSNHQQQADDVLSPIIALDLAMGSPFRRSIDGRELASLFHELTNPPPFPKSILDLASMVTRAPLHGMHPSAHGACTSVHHPSSDPAAATCRTHRQHHPTNDDRSAMPNTTHSSRAGQQSAITAPPHRRP